MEGVVGDWFGQPRAEMGLACDPGETQVVDGQAGRDGRDVGLWKRWGIGASWADGLSVLARSDG